MKTESLDEIGYKYTEENKNTIIYNKDIKYIVFLKETQTLMLPCNLTMQELQAINKKCEELKWI